jgi:hypothetical protein
MAMNMGMMQMLAMLAAKNPQLVASLAASQGLQPPSVSPEMAPVNTAPQAPAPQAPAAAILEPGAPGASGTPGTPGGLPVNAGAAATGMPDTSLANALAAVGAPTMAPAGDAGGMNRTPAPSAPNPQQGQFNPQAMALMQMLMQSGQRATGPTSLASLIGR